MLEELGISFGTAVVILIAMYFVIKGAGKSAMEESTSEISKAVKKGIENYYEENAAMHETLTDVSEDSELL